MQETGQTIATSAVLVANTNAADADDRSRLSGRLAELVKKIPTGDYDSAGSVLDEIFASGAAGIRQVIATVGDQFGDPHGVQPKYAVHGLVHRTSRPGAAKQRAILASALAEELGAEHSDDLKAFICRQLQLLGGDREAEALAAQ